MPAAGIIDPGYNPINEITARFGNEPMFYFRDRSLYRLALRSLPASGIFHQTRLSAWFRSEITGVVLMSIIFGLAHAPGFIFRHAGAVEGLGANPTVLDAIAYSIATLAISGVFFGIIWARTKNLFALVLVHAAADLFPNLSDFVKT